MLVLDALFDHFQQISSNVEIIGSLVQCSPISAIDVRVGAHLCHRQPILTLVSYSSNVNVTFDGSS